MQQTERRFVITPQLEELDRLIEPWLDDFERTSRLRGSGPDGLDLRDDALVGAAPSFDQY